MSGTTALIFGRGRVPQKTVAKTPDMMPKLYGATIPAGPSGCAVKYANTNGYKNIADEQVDWSYWVYQIAKIFEYNSNIQFTIYNLANWECPKDWQFKNIKVDIIENL